ncbi:hypothetical protein [Paenibacillus odorifer]|uniref:hypothetical protein n=1 Tax=Paenibacillus odorifer TaxID=189426 RepID=UPI0028A05612|nr:hypothetical protein [Paenibacillus odorifer]
MNSKFALVLKSIMAMIILISTLGIRTNDKVYSAVEQKKVIGLKFYYNDNKEMQQLVPTVKVYEMDYSNGDETFKEYEFVNMAFPYPDGYSTDWNVIREYTGEAMEGEDYNLFIDNRTVVIDGRVYGYGLYQNNKRIYSGKHPFADSEHISERLYFFDYANKELKLLRTAAHINKNRFYPIPTWDSEGNSIYSETWDTTITGTTLSVHPSNNTYILDNTATKQLQFYSFTDNTTYLTVKSGDYLGKRDLSSCTRSYACYFGNDTVSVNDNLVIRMNGKIYEMNQQRHLSEIKKIDTSGERWKIQFGDYILERQQRLYMTNQKTKQKIAITPQNAYVRAIHLSPDRRYLVSELWPSQEKPIYSVYDTVAQKKIRDIELPYTQYPSDVTWHSNTILEYTPFTSSRPLYIKDVHIDILKGIITKEDIKAFDSPGEYVIVSNSLQNYFTYARPSKILYKDKPVVYTNQPAFLGMNELLYCSIKDLAITIGAGIRIEGRQVIVSLKNKQATVDLDSKDVLVQGGVVYAPVKAIVLKLGLKYTRGEEGIIIE